MTPCSLPRPSPNSRAPASRSRPSPAARAGPARAGRVAHIRPQLANVGMNAGKGGSLCMHKTFLFRFDGARENDDFLNHAVSQGHVVYSGIEMKLTRGWVPDFLEVSLDDNPVACSLTMFELESTETAARVSARKYLPEPSDDILEKVLQYLLRVLQRCRQTADPRGGEIKELYDALARTAHARIWTAAALRQPPRIVERLPLIDQGLFSARPATELRTCNQKSLLRGELSLSAREHKTLSRSILVLDAVTDRKS